MTIHRDRFFQIAEFAGTSCCDLRADCWQVWRTLGRHDFETEDPETFFRLYGCPPEPSVFWQLRTDCGIAFSVQQSWCDPDLIQLWVADEREAQHVRMHLPFRTRIEWVRHTSRLLWAVRRIDNSGGQYDVMTVPSESSARCVLRLLEDRAHKQTYFIESTGVAQSPAPEAPQWKPRWRVLRQDDNGHRFELCATMSESYAEWVTHNFERAEPANKQTYWVEAAHASVDGCSR